MAERKDNLDEKRIKNENMLSKNNARKQARENNSWATGTDKESYRLENEDKLIGKETIKREMNVTSRGRYSLRQKCPPPPTS